MNTLLVLTVGGSPEPVLVSLLHHRPARVRFVHTPQTAADVAATIIPRAVEAGLVLDSGRYDLLELSDGQDLVRCVEQLREITEDVERWAARGPDHQIIVDLTGGTKCMSAALALQARTWPCTFSYVGGVERTKQGVGVVVTGRESVVHQANPWDALGRQALDTFVVLFDQGAFTAAARVVAEASPRVARAPLKRELAVLGQLAMAFEAYERFDRAACVPAFSNVSKAANDLRSALGRTVADRVLDGGEHIFARLSPDRGPPTMDDVIDLMSNADRRRREGRFDDAVARMYRAIEAMAQVTLSTNHGIPTTAQVPLDRVPEPLRAAWSDRAKEGHLQVALQEAYLILGALGDPLADRFSAAGLDGPHSLLSVRNRSVLAHGFDCVTEPACRQLWAATLKVSGVSADSLVAFPRLGR